jgi:hypothetical protein
MLLLKPSIMSVSIFFGYRLVFSSKQWKIFCSELSSQLFKIDSDTNSDQSESGSDANSNSESEPDTDSICNDPDPDSESESDWSGSGSKSGSNDCDSDCECKKCERKRYYLKTIENIDDSLEKFFNDMPFQIFSCKHKRIIDLGFPCGHYNYDEYDNYGSSEKDLISIIEKTKKMNLKDLFLWKYCINKKSPKLLAQPS